MVHSKESKEGVALLYLTPTGGALATRLEQGLAAEGLSVEVFPPDDAPLADLISSCWGRYESLILIMAVGIVVRLVAPLVRSKWDDPGVVVVDEGGNFAVSLLGGHWGKSNALSRTVAAVLGATPVVTTATDVHGKPAVDTLARKLGMQPWPRERVKLANSAILSGKQVVFYTEWELNGCEELPGIEVVPSREFPESVQGFPVFVTSRIPESLPTGSLCLCPPSLAAGIGCKRGVSAEEVEQALLEALRRAGRQQKSVAVLASHEIKSDEAGLCGFALKEKLPLRFFGSEVLQGVMDNYPGLADSSFVCQQIGVGGVCETAALAAVPKGELVLPKTKLGRVTVALAEAGLLWSESGQAIRRI